MPVNSQASHSFTFVLVGPNLLKNTSSILCTDALLCQISEEPYFKVSSLKIQKTTWHLGIAACFEVCATQNAASVKVVGVLGPHGHVRLLAVYSQSSLAGREDESPSLLM